MIVCPVCQFRNPDANVRCFKCNALLQDNAEDVRGSLSRADHSSPPYVWLRFLGFLAWLNTWNPLKRLWQIPQNVAYRFPWTAGGLSLLPGLGQLYNRQPVKAAVIGSLWWAAAGICLITIHDPHSNYLLMVLLLSWLLVWNDAVASAVRINGEYWSFRNSIALWFAAMFLVGTSLVITQALGLNFFALVRIVHDAHSPALKKGDLIFVNNMSYWFWLKPRLGDVVQYNPGSFKAEKGNNILLINLQDNFQRVVGIEGDHIEKRKGRFYRNGVELSKIQEPILGDAIPDFVFDIPPGRYFLPVTAIPDDFWSAALGGSEAKAPKLFAPGWIFQDWDKAGMVEEPQIFGRAVAIINPPERRKWL